MGITWDPRNQTISASKWGVGQFARKTFDYAVPTAEFAPVADIVEQVSQSISEAEVAELYKDNDAYYVRLHQNEPANEEGYYQRIEVTMTVAVYYGLRLRKRWDSDGPLGRLWLPDTWDPQHSVLAEESHLWIGQKFAYLTYYFPVNTKLKCGDRVWTELWLPVDVLNLPNKGSGVASCALSINLVQREAMAGKSLPEDNPSLAGSVEWVDSADTIGSEVP